MENKSITAVEWLEQEFIKLESTTGVFGIMYELIEKAKEIEKEHLMMAFNDGKINQVLNKRNSEQYYNEVYGK